MTKPKKGQTWVGDFGPFSTLTLTRVSESFVYFHNAFSCGILRRDFFEKHYTVQPKRRAN